MRPLLVNPGCSLCERVPTCHRATAALKVQPFRNHLALWRLAVQLKTLGGIPTKEGVRLSEITPGGKGGATTVRYKRATALIPSLLDSRHNRTHPERLNSKNLREQKKQPYERDSI